MRAGFCSVSLRITRKIKVVRRTGEFLTMHEDVLDMLSDQAKEPETINLHTKTARVFAFGLGCDGRPVAWEFTTSGLEILAIF